MKKRRSGILVFNVLFILGLLSFVFSCSSGAKGKEIPQARAVPVSAGAAVMKGVPLQVRSIGNIEAFSDVSVKTRVDGELINVYFKEGQDVRKDDLLFKIDPRPFETALMQSEANLAKDNAQAKNAAEEAKRYAILVQKDYVAKEQYDQVLANSEALSAAVKADQALVENYKLQVQYCTIRSPLSGRVGSLLVHEGNMVKANDTVLVTINQITPVNVTFSVPEQYLPDIKRYAGMGTLKVEAVIPGDEQRPVLGRLAFINNAVDKASGTILLKGTFANGDKRLWPGQFVNVVLTLTVQPNAIVVPAQAVQTGQAGTYVYVIKSDMTSEARPIKAGRTLNDETVVDKGLSAGERVVTDGQLRLLPGSKVEIINEAAKKEAAKPEGKRK